MLRQTSRSARGCNDTHASRALGRGAPRGGGGGGGGGGVRRHYWRGAKDNAFVLLQAKAREAPAHASHTASCCRGNAPFKSQRRRGRRQIVELACPRSETAARSRRVLRAALGCLRRSAARAGARGTGAGGTAAGGRQGQALPPGFGTQSQRYQRARAARRAPAAGWPEFRQCSSLRQKFHGDARHQRAGFTGRTPPDGLPGA